MDQPDLIQNSVSPTKTGIAELGERFKQLRITDNVRELQTVLRDKCVFFLSQKLRTRTHVSITYRDLNDHDKECHLLSTYLSTLICVYI